MHWWNWGIAIIRVKVNASWYFDKIWKLLFNCYLHLSFKSNDFLKTMIDIFPYPIFMWLFASGTQKYCQISFTECLFNRLIRCTCGKVSLLFRQSNLSHTHGCIMFGRNPLRFTLRSSCEYQYIAKVIIIGNVQIYSVANWSLLKLLTW